jgi:hypothetical protein
VEDEIKLIEENQQYWKSKSNEHMKKELENRGMNISNINFVAY